MRSGNRSVRAAIAAGVLAGAAVLGGCAESPSVAAIVNGTEIPTEQFTADLEGVQRISRLTGDQVLSALIQAQVAEDLADEEGLIITDADREAELNPEVLAVTDARHFVLELADIQIVIGEVGEQAFDDAIRAADVTVNPRFGRWDSEQSPAVIPGVGSLSRPAENRS